MRVLAFLVVAAALRRPETSLLQQQYTADLQNAKLSPVQKVVAMLKDMRSNLDKEFKQDEEMFKKLNCWCNSNNGEKQDAIEANMAKAAQLESQITSNSAKKTELEEQIATTAAELQANREALAKATAVRDEEKAVFQKQELSSTEDVQSLKAAIVVLSKHQGTENETEQLKDAFKYQGMKGPIGGDFLQRKNVDVSKLTPLLQKRLDAPTAARVLSAIQEPKYTNQSGEIFGVLTTMLEQMQEDMSEAAKEEQAKSAAFADLKEAKEEEISGAERLLEEKEKQLAKTMKQLADDKEDLKDTNATLASDREFLASLIKQCKSIDEQWAARTKVRREELQAVSETIGILTSDDARDTFHGTFGHGQAEGDQEVLLQEKASNHQAFNARVRAAEALTAAGRRAADRALLQLAHTVRLDAFTKVKKAINDMIAMLKQQQGDEVKQKDFCETQFHDNEQQTTATNFQRQDLEQTVSDLESAIEGLSADLESLAQQENEAKVELQRASLNRRTESKEFLAAYGEQLATEKVLRIALSRMEKFYNKKALLQASQFALQTPPGGFQEYAPSAASSPVLEMLNNLITDAKKMQIEAKAEEQKATDEYANFVSESNKSIAALQRHQVNKRKERADRQTQLTDTKAELRDTVAELERLDEYKGQLHVSCDYVMRNFDTRQQARADEVEALNAALGILSGA